MPDIAEIAKVKTDPETGTIVREGVPSVVNPFDEFAVEEAVRVKERLEEDVKITIITMGPPQAEEALVKCLAMGADDAVMLDDPAFEGGDSHATAYSHSQTVSRCMTIAPLKCRVIEHYCIVMQRLTVWL